MKRQNLKRTSPSHTKHRYKKLPGLSLALTLMIAVPFSASAQGLPGPIQVNTRESANIFVDLAEQVVPSVVNISTRTHPKRRRPDNGDPFRRDFERFFGFGWEGHLGRRPRQALGTGVVIESRKGMAIVLTNHHVIEGANEIDVQFTKESKQGTVRGKIVGKDPMLDLALIEVQTKGQVHALRLGDSEKLKVGEYVIAVGNPFGQGHSVSHGIISAKGRIAPTAVGRYLQTDAPINPGNSGGPLVNLKGEIIGINNAILAQAQGIGFAIPSNDVKGVLKQLRTKGKVDRGYIGIRMGEITPEAASFAGPGITPGQPYVALVEPGSPAEKAGLQLNDVIVGINGQEIESSRDLLLGVTKTPIGKTAKLKVIRSGQKVNLKVRVDKRPTA